MNKEKMRSSLRWQIVVLTVIRFVMAIAFRMVYPFRSDLERGLGVSFAQMSWGLSLRGLVGLAGPLLASVSDLRGRRSGMLVGLGVFIAGTLVVLVWPTFAGFILAMMVITLGKFAFDPSVHAFIGDSVPYKRRGTVLAVNEMSWSAAFLVGMLAVSLLMFRFGWQAPFPAIGLLAALGWLVLRKMLPQDPPAQPSKQPFSANFKTVFASPNARAAIAMTALFCSANEVVNLVFGPWLQESFGLNLLALGSASAVIGLSELSGEGLVSLVTDRLGKKRAVAYGLLANSLAAVLLPVIGTNISGALAGLFLFYLTFEFTIVSSVPIMTELLPQARSTLVSLNFASASLGRVVGAWIIPLLYSLGFSASAWASAFINLLALALLSKVNVGED